jgi:hypothetical protein
MVPAVAVTIDPDKGVQVGRDPRTMTKADLVETGHVARSPVRAIRAKCLDCCGGSAAEVRRCLAVTCPLWPFRMGASPWRTWRETTEREREALAKASAARRARIVGYDDFSPHGPSCGEDRG